MLYAGARAWGRGQKGRPSRPSISAWDPPSPQLQMQRKTNIWGKKSSAGATWCCLPQSTPKEIRLWCWHHTYLPLIEGKKLICRALPLYNSPWPFKQAFIKQRDGCVFQNACQSINTDWRISTACDQ